jgi:hypothetical protein
VKVGGIKVAVRQGVTILITNEALVLAPVAFPNIVMVYEVPIRAISEDEIPIVLPDKVIFPPLIV